jgi:formylglycine-generating enzyme
MTTQLGNLVIVLSLFAGLDRAAAHEARFFRISGPIATRITEIRPDGTVVWTNAPTNATFTVQTATSVSGQSDWVDWAQVPSTNATTTNRLFDPNPPAGMVFIPAGSFTMGDNWGDGAAGAWPNEVPLHAVYVSAFYMDQTEVTTALWDRVYAWAITHGYSFDHAGLGRAGAHPVQMIDWYDMVKWCNARSELEGRTPAYYTNSAQTTVYRTGLVDVTNESVRWNSGYRLPTEAEWEKAARGGSGGQRFPWGNTISWSQANYYAYPLSAGGYTYDVNPMEGYHPAFETGDWPFTSPVGCFAPNGYGLYDTAGNVWEWCWDWVGTYGSATQTDPRGPTSGPSRVFRGGDYFHGALACRTSYRYGNGPASSYYGIGFRCVHALGQ